MQYNKRDYPSEHDDRDRRDYKRRRRSVSRDRRSRWSPSPPRRSSKMNSRSPDSWSSYNRTRSRSRSRSRPRSRRRSRSRSRSPYSSRSSRVKTEIKSEMKREPDPYYHYSNDPYHYSNIDQTGQNCSDLSQEEKNSLETLFCNLCSVKLGDPVSMLGHVRGIKHIQAKKNRGDRIPAAEDGGIDPNFWIKKENMIRAEQASKDPLYDTKRFEHVKAKYNKNRYDHGQFSKSRQLYCETCGVTVHSRDTMENHLQGAEHNRRAQRVKKYECKICLIVVPCQNTLNAHFKGKDHLKRENEALRMKKKLITQDGNQEVDTDLTPEEEVELRDLTKVVKNLQRQVKELREKNFECKKNHKDIDELKRKKKGLEEEVLIWKRKYEQEKAKETIKKEDTKDTKVKCEAKPKEEYHDVPDGIDIIDID